MDVISIETAEWGWTGLIPGFGLLNDEFPEPALKIWALDKEGGFAWFDQARGIKIPLNPFAGEMGVASWQDGLVLHHTSLSHRRQPRHSAAYCRFYLIFACGSGRRSIFNRGKTNLFRALVLAEMATRTGIAAQGDGGTLS